MPLKTGRGYQTTNQVAGGTSRIQPTCDSLLAIEDSWHPMVNVGESWVCVYCDDGVGERGRVLQLKNYVNETSSRVSTI